MDLNTWWTDDAEQRFWMETTDRDDIGADLHAPTLGDNGKPTPSYSLVREVKDGDIVFHYEKDKKPPVIRSWSVAYGGFWEAETMWGTPRSTGPTGHPVEPYPRPGRWYGLHGPFPMPEALTLEELREAEATVLQVRAEVEGAHTGAIYFPFMRYPTGLRSAQGYLSKMPKELVTVVPKLAAVAVPDAPPQEVPLADGPPDDLGDEYIPVDEETNQPDRDPFGVDPSVVERGLTSHKKLQNAVAAHAKAKGFKVNRPKPHNPRWDVLWIDDEDVVWFGEVKSLTTKNEERQLRYGLGQLLRYRHRLQQAGTDARAVLIAEYEPSDPEWQELCDGLGVVLVWPNVLAERL
jgi:hypothetical protein